jgi:hypothetical protein
MDVPAKIGDCAWVSAVLSRMNKTIVAIAKETLISRTTARAWLPSLLQER